MSDAGPWSPSAVLRRILAAARGAPDGLRVLRLFDLPPDEAAALADEARRLCGLESPSAVTDEGHVTNWTGPQGHVVQFSLVNRSGRLDDFTEDHDLSCLGKYFAHRDRYPALGRWLDGIPHLVNARLNVLGPGSSLQPHQEHVVFRTAGGGVGARLRFHLPLVTSDGAELLLDGEVHNLDARSVYFVNHGCAHAARNGGDADRLHLVWDLLLTAEAHAWAFAGGHGRPGAPVEPPPRRREDLRGHRRLLSPIPSNEVDAVALCPEQ